jgi:hypothetical protein
MPFVMFFANLRMRLVDFQAYSPWGFPLFVMTNLVTLIVSLAFFFLASNELDRARHQNPRAPIRNSR